MVKRYLTAVIIIFMFLLSSCNIQPSGYAGSVSKDDTVTYSLNGNANVERLQKFIDNAGSDKEDRINIVRYTTEGDPMITQLYFNKGSIDIFTDNSKDKFGGPDKEKILHDKITGGNQLQDNLMKYLKDNHFQS